MTISSASEYPLAVERLQDAALAYYTLEADAVTMTDAEYDELLGEVESYEQAHPDEVIDHGLLTSVAAGTATGDVPHSTPMLSLEKVTDEAAVEKFLDRVVASGAPTGIFVQPKLDGLAIRAVYRGGLLVQVVTRGDGQAGEDVTERIMRDNVFVDGLPSFLEQQYGVPMHVDAEIRGELLMSRDDFAASNTNRMESGKPGFANPRNAAAGSLRAETLDYDVEMTFVTYDHDAGLELATGLIYADQIDGAVTLPAEDVEGILRAVHDFAHVRPGYLYPTDGIVLKAAAPDTREVLGTGTRAPKWAVAWKYQAQTGETVIRDILVEVGRTGNLSFTAVFDPVLVDGSTISRASLHNTALIAEKDIRIGSKAVVYKAGDIIPQVLSVTNPPVVPYADLGPWVAPTEDADGYPYVSRGKFLTSTNPADSVGALVRYAASRDVLDIDGLGSEIADALVAEELVGALDDLFRLDESLLASLPLGETSTGALRRLGEKNAKKLFDGIQASKKQPLNRVITALGIRLTGRTFGRRLASHFGSLDALLNATSDDLLAVEGVGPERAAVISAGVAANERVIRALIDLGVTSAVEQDAGGAPKPLIVDGKPLSVVVTGAMTGPLASYARTAMNELIESLGGKASGSVSKNTGLLVCGEEGSSKWVKANDLGVRIVTPEEFAEIAGIS